MDNNYSTKRQVKKTLFIFTLIILSLFFIAILTDILEVSNQVIFIVSYGYCIFFVWLILALKIRLLTGCMVGVYYMLIQAIGVPLAYLFDSKYVLEQLNRSKYYYGEYVPKYIALSLLAVSCILFGIIYYTNKRKSIRRIQPSAVAEPPNQEYVRDIPNIFYYIGAFSITCFALYMLFHLLKGSYAIGNYDGYKSWANFDPIRNYLQISYWISAVFVCAAGSKKQIGRLLLIFAIPTLILLLTGNRNDALYPLVIGLGLYSMRFKKIPVFISAFTLAVILLLSPLIVLSRNGINLGMRTFSLPQMLSQSLFELGGQIPPLSAMFSWLEHGENLAMGMTYILGIVGSLFNDFIPNLKTTIAASRYWIPTRLPSLGFSNSGEVYFNFGIIGVCVVFLIIGIYYAKRENTCMTTNQFVRYGFLSLLALTLVRSSFTYSFVYVKVFVVLYLIELILNKKLRGKRLIRDKEDNKVT